MEDSSNAKTPDTETPPQPKPTISKSISFPANGTLKRHHSPPVVVFYRECLKNHAAAIGGLALDGCGEFMPSPSATQTDPTSLKCAACGCHRNFHRRELEEPSGGHFISFHHPQRLPPPLNRSLTPSPSQSPPPVHMLLALSNGFSGDEQAQNPARSENPSRRKRFRTKFSQSQKEKMQSFAEKMGWKMQRSDERMVEQFCNEVGVSRGVLKVWMHNNKHSNNIGKRDHQINQISNNTNENGNTEDQNGNGNGSCRVSFDTDAYNNNTDNENHLYEGNSVHLFVSTNGSSSSS